MRMGTDKNRGIPVVTKFLFAGNGLGLDVDRLTRSTIKSTQIALLGFAVDDIGVLGIDGTIVAITANRYSPVGVSNSGNGSSSGWTVLRVVVLSSSDHVVEGQVVVDIQFVELSQWQIGRVLVGFRVVPRPIQSPVASDQQKVGIRGMKGDRMVVDMFVRIANRVERRASIFGSAELNVGVIKHIESVRVAIDFLIVVRAGASRDIVAHLGPALTTIFRPPDTSRRTCQFDCRINDI